MIATGIEWTKITAIAVIGALAAELVAFGRADLGANLGMAVLAYLFGNYQGKKSAGKSE